MKKSVGHGLLHPHGRRLLSEDGGEDGGDDERHVENDGLLEVEAHVPAQGRLPAHPHDQEVDSEVDEGRSLVYGKQRV